MQRMDLPVQSSNPTFIGSWIIEPLTICDDLITYFESNPTHQKQGSVGGGENLSFKDSTDIKVVPNDLEFPGNDILRKYIDALCFCFKLKIPIITIS